MKFEPHFLQQIKDALPVSTVTGRRVMLKKVGKEWRGLSPFNKERTPSFYVNDQKQAWFDFSSGKNGNIFDFSMLTDGLSFPEAVKALAAEAGIALQRDVHVRERTPEQRRRWEEEQAQRQSEFEERRRAQESEEEMDEAQRIALAHQIWHACIPIAGTIGEKYLTGRGIPAPPCGWPAVIRFHKALRHPTGRAFPAVVARVEDAGGNLTAIWRIYLDQSGGKAGVDGVKLGLGAAAGGAVRIGGMGAKIGVAEGVETALAAWTLERYRYPVWSVLSTSGMKRFEVPLTVERVIIWPDGDFPKSTPDGGIADPPGIRAARDLERRCKTLEVAVTVNEPPRCGTDYLDVLKVRLASEAA